MLMLPKKWLLTSGKVVSPHGGAYRLDESIQVSQIGSLPCRGWACRAGPRYWQRRLVRVFSGGFQLGQAYPWRLAPHRLLLGQELPLVPPDGRRVVETTVIMDPPTAKPPELDIITRLRDQSGRERRLQLQKEPIELSNVMELAGKQKSRWAFIMKELTLREKPRLASNILLFPRFCDLEKRGRRRQTEIEEDYWNMG